MGSDPSRKIDRGPITSLAESAGTSRGSGGKLGWDPSGRALLLAAEPIGFGCH